MGEWQPIETAPRDGTLVLVAHIRNGTVYWVAMAGYVYVTTGHIHCASYHGWEPLLPFMAQPGRRRGEEVPDGIIGAESPPTHWMPIHEPPKEVGDG